MRKILVTVSVVLLAFIITSCKDGVNNSTVPYTVVQEQTVGNVKVTVLSEGGVILSGYGTIKVEFRNASGELINVNNLSAEAQITTGGTSYTGQMNIVNTNTAGSYNIDYYLPMKGTWIFTIYFNSQSVQFLLSVI